MEGQKVDNVNHPAHYAASTSIECIEAMELIFDWYDVQTFCLCNAFKYIWRHKHKNGLEDLDKAHRFLAGHGAWMGFFAFLPILGSAITIALGLMRSNIIITFIAITLGKIFRYVILIYGAGLFL